MRTKSAHKSDPHGYNKRPWDPKFIRLAYVACAEGGLSESGIARLFDVTDQTIRNWQRKHPKFKKAIRRGRYEHDSRKVVTSLLKKALGYDYVEVSKEDITIKQGKGDNQIELPATKVRTTTKHVCPSDTAIIFWLTNRQPQEWQHIQKMLMKGQVNHDVEGQVEHKHEYDLKSIPKEELESIRDILAKHAEAAGLPNAQGGGRRISLPHSPALHPAELAPGRN
jgi:transposase-like protein